MRPFVGLEKWLLGALCFFLLLSGCRSEEPRYPTSGSQVIAFGDSLVRGKGTSPGENWVSLLSQRFDITILNKGKNGDTTRSALARVGRDVLAHDPRVVMILLGGNDALRRVPQDETFSNLNEIIDQIQLVGAAVVLIGVRGGLLGDPYHDAFEALAKQKQVFFIPDILQGILGHPDLLADRVHPNNRGHQRMAERIGVVLEQIWNE